jgi:hypothetical protein
VLHDSVAWGEFFDELPDKEKRPAGNLACGPFQNDGVG